MSRLNSPKNRGLAAEFTVSLVTLALISVALGAHRPFLLLILFVSVVSVSLVVRKCLSSVPFLTTTLSVAIPVYICIYALLATQEYEGGSPLLVYIGCLLPLASFVFSVWRQRKKLNQRLRHWRVNDHFLARGIGWIVVIVALIAISGGISIAAQPGWTNTLPLFFGMVVVAILVTFIVDNLVILLAVTGHLFTRFVKRMIRRAVPIFSFLIISCLTVIIFGALYSILDVITGQPNFAMRGSAHSLDLADAIYFSVETISTIGYGDIVAVSGEARTLTIIEVVAGVVLFLFAFAEIAAYDPEIEQALGGNDEDTHSKDDN